MRGVGQSDGRKVRSEGGVKEEEEKRERRWRTTGNDRHKEESGGEVNRLWMNQKSGTEFTTKESHGKGLEGFD